MIPCPHGCLLHIYTRVTNNFTQTMHTLNPTTNAKLKRATRLRQTALGAAEGAMTSAPSYQGVVLDAAAELIKVAESDERKAKKYTSDNPVAKLPDDATANEVSSARRRQSVRKGKDTFLPSWKDMAVALPAALLRSALFESGQSVQANSSAVLTGDKRLMVANKEVASLGYFTLTLSGYELCQFDRHVYATCLDYFRDRALSRDDNEESVKTSFYEFISRMGKHYGVTTHKAVRASLLRLSMAQLRLRLNRWNLEVPKLLTVSFEDGAIDGNYMASDLLNLRVNERVAELFGPGAWTAVDKDAAAYDGLKGWLASFYASHSGPAWLDVSLLHKISGYSPNFANFKASLKKALEKLKDNQTPLECRVSEYLFTTDGKKVRVTRTAWANDKKG